MIEIYDRSNAILVEVPILDTSVRHHALMGENYVRLDFELAENIEFPKGCYIIYEGFRFEIFTDVDPDFNEETGGWKYSIQFEGVEGHLKKYNVFYRGQGFEEAVFALTTTLTSFGNLIAECINHELGSSNWVVKDVPEDLSEITKGISFSGDKLYDALGMIANEFDCEWWIEQNGDLVYICFGKLEFGSEEIFRRGEVVATMPRRSGDNSNYGTRFYVFGSTRNLTSDYGHASQGGVTNHISEIRLRLPDGIPYIDAWEPLAKEDIVEQLVFFEDVFPKNTETVTSVETEERVDDEGNKFTAYIMYVANTPFTPSDIIEGETIRCTFESGPLEGREFELSINTKAFDKKFEIIAVTEGEGSITIPNENLKPEPGNKFILTGVRLPKQRTTEAEQELLKHGKTWAKKNSSDTNVYECPTNPVYCQVNDKNYDLGQKVKLVGDRFGSIGRSSRIQAYEKKLINPYEATYTVGDNTVYSRLGSIETNIKENQYAERIGVVSGVGIYIIRKYDNTAPTDYNVFSALRAMENFHPKGGRKALDFAAGNMNAAGSLTVEKDIQSGGDIQTQKSITAGQDIDAKGNVTAQGNIESGAEIIAKDKFATDNFRKGNISGSGAAIYKDSTGSSVVEADKMIIRKEAVFNELIINQMSFRLGETVFSNGGFECTSVQEENTYYRCYYDNKNGTRYSGIVVGDQARCQRYSPDNKSIIKYFWALVTGVGDDYVDISKTDKDGSGIPAEGDNIVQFGNRTDVARQSAIVIDARDGGSIQVLAKIDSFDLTDKNYIGIGVNPVTGRAYQYVYGDMFCGDRNLDDPEATYITFQQAPGDTKPRMRMNTDVIIGKNSSGLKNLSEWPEVKQDIDTAKDTAQEAKDAAASLNTTVTGLKNFTDEAFADGIVDRAEAASIEKYINTVNEAGSAADATYGKLYNNPYLGGSAKTDLTTKKSAFDAAKVSLLNAISAAIADGKASEAEVRNVNAQYTEFNAAYKDFTRAIEDANQAIQDELKSYSDAAQDAADAAAARVAELEFLKSAFSDMTTEISDGLLLTGFVGVRDSASNIVAGLSGINPYSDLSRYPILFGGATSAKAANDAKFRFYSDGYFVLGGDRMVFEPTTSSLTVRGAIYASSGEFRGKVYASGGEFTGKVVATSGEFTGTVHASAGEFTGTITASSGKVGDFVIDNGNLLNTKNSGNIKFTYGESYVVIGNSVDYDGTYGGLIVKARDTQTTAVGISIFAWGTPSSIAIDIQRGDLFLGSSSKIHGFATSTKYFTSGSIVLEKQHDYVEYGGSSEGSILLPDGQDGKVVWVKKSGSGNLVVRSRTLGKIIRMGSSLVDSVVINWTTECKFTFIGSTGYWNYANYNN